MLRCVTLCYAALHYATLCYAANLPWRHITFMAWLVTCHSRAFHYFHCPSLCSTYSSIHFLLIMSSNTRTTRLSTKLAKDSTPSVAQLLRLSALDELTISNNSGDSDVFRPNDWWVRSWNAVNTYCWSTYSVFIKHPLIDQASPAAGHQYWKAQLLSIHTFKTRSWVRVRWFYSATQLKAEGHQWVDIGFNDALHADCLARPRIPELGCLGNTELVLTDHEDAVLAGCIEGKSIKPSETSLLMQTFSDHCHIRKFDDTDIKAEWLHPAAWYYRLECEFKPNGVPSFKVCILHLLALPPDSTASDRESI